MNENLRTLSLRSKNDVLIKKKSIIKKVKINERKKNMLGRDILFS